MGAQRRVTTYYLLRAAVAVARDPNDSAAGARLVLGLDRDRIDANCARMRADPVGARVLECGPTLYERLCNRGQLSAMPETSLGRAYLAFVEREGISTEGLHAAVSPVEAELWPPDPALQRYLRHIRASHDLWHVLTGYGRDLLGELLVIAFSYEQLQTRVFGWIARANARFADRQMPGATALLAEARERGARAQWLPCVDWGTHLPRPLDSVRRELGIGCPPQYQRYVRKPRGFGLMPEPAGGAGLPARSAPAVLDRTPPFLVERSAAHVSAPAAPAAAEGTAPR